MGEGFDLDLSDPQPDLIWKTADRIQTILMEARQEMTPECPIHPGLHPLESSLIAGNAVWKCPNSDGFLREVLST